MTTLWKNQIEAIVMARDVPNLALFHEAGTGKTCSMVNILREDFNKYKSIRDTLIFAPVSVVPQWKTAFQKFSKIPEERVVTLSGTGRQKADQVFDVIESKKQHIIVTNYEAIQSDPLKEALYEWKPTIVVFDESHRLKDSTGVRFKRIKPLALEAKRKFLLTGTPVLQSQLDLFGQFMLLDDRVFGRNYYFFKSKYFYDANAGMPKHVHFPDWKPRPGSDKEISRLIAPLSTQARKSECLDLPPLLQVTIPVTLSDKQAKTYVDMQKEFVAEVNEKQVTAEFAMTKTLRMQQILCGFIQPDGSDSPEWLDDVPRLQALKDLLESIGKQKVIVWTNFKATYKAIGKVCDSLGLKYVFFTGEQNEKEKAESKKEFIEGEASVFIANPAAGGTGTDGLQCAAYAIYYSVGYSLGDYLQSAARNFRGGSEQHDKITHYFLVASGTLDEVILHALQHKKKVGDAILQFAKDYACAKQE